jgi:Family of unknown function (DUF6317)
MSDGYQVVMADLLSASGVFADESTALSEAVSGAGPSAPDGGDSVINSALPEALRAAVLTTSQLAAVIDSHAQKLRTAYDRYHDAEETNTQLCQQLTRLLPGT